MKTFKNIYNFFWERLQISRNDVIFRQRLEQELAQLRQEFRERAADIELNTSQNLPVRHAF